MPLLFHAFEQTFVVKIEKKKKHTHTHRHTHFLATVSTLRVREVLTGNIQVFLKEGGGSCQGGVRKLVPHGGSDFALWT